MVQGRSPDDVVFAAHIDDHISEFFDMFDKRVDKSAENAEAGFDKVDEAVLSTESSMGGLVDTFLGGGDQITEILAFLETSIGGVSVATLAMSAIVVAAFVAAAAAVAALSYQMSLLAAPTGEAITAMDHLAKIHGIEKDAARASANELEALGMTSEESARAVVELIRAEIDLADTHKLAQKAANFQATTGREYTEVLTGMINAIKEGNVAALAQYDIFLEEAVVMEDYAKAIDKPVKSLSELDRRQALLNATLEDADRHIGAYEAGILNVTGQSEDLARNINEMKVQFGLAFQESHAEVLQIINNKLEDMVGWIVDNKDTIKDWSTVTVNVILKILETVTKLADGLIWLFGIPKRLAAGTAGAILEAFDIPEDLIKERLDGVGVAFRQVVAIIVGAVQTGAGVLFTFVEQSWDALVVLGDVAAAALKGDIEEIGNLFDEFGERAAERFGDGDFAGKISSDFSKNVAEMGELLNIMEDVEAESQEVDAAFAGTGDAALRMAASIEEAAKSFTDLFEDYQQEIARAGVEATRRQIETQLRTTHRLQDIQRNFNQRISDALEGANEDRKKAIEKNNEERIDIFRDYHRRIEDIQQEFNRNAHELARKRDAVGLMELIRNNKYMLDEEKEARDERIADQDRLFRKELKHIQIRKQEEITAIMERRQAEIENLKRSLDRQRELEALHRQWQIEDRQEKYRQRLEDMVEHYVQEENLTYEHLQNMLDQWGAYFTGLNEMLASMMVISAGGGGGAALSWEDLMRLKQQESGILGQGGLVSAMLPPSRGFDIPKDAGRSVPRIPTVYPGSSDRSGSRDINVRVTGDALDPIIQRELVRSLLEIERNRE